MPKAPVAPATGREVTPEIVADLKAQLVAHGLPERLYKFRFDKDEILFRPLLLADYLLVQEFIQANEGRVKQDEIDHKLCEKGIVWPGDLIWHEQWEMQPAGLQSTLAKQILARSGFLVEELDQSAYMSVDVLTTVEHGPKPAPAVVEALKAKYKWPLKLVQVDSEYYGLRPLSRAEWKLISAEAPAEMDLVAAQRACIWSRDYPAAPNFAERVAGTTRTLSEVVMQISGFASAPVVEEL